MKNKYLVTVIVPVIEFELDVYIPNNKKVGTIKKYIIASLKELSNNSYNKEIDDVRIIERDTFKELDNNLYVKDAGIQNGSKLIII